MPESARTDRWKTSRILASILFAAVVSFSACTPTYSLMEGDELFAFWDMSHPLYHGRTLHVLMPEGYYHSRTYRSNIAAWNASSPGKPRVTDPGSETWCVSPCWNPARSLALRMRSRT